MCLVSKAQSAECAGCSVYDVRRGDAILKREACMGPGVGAQRRGPVPKRMSDENHHDCTGLP